MSLRLPLPRPGIALDAEHRRALLGQATAQHLRGELAQAETQYLGLLAADANDSDVLFLLGTLYLQAAAWDSAIEYLQRLVQSQPKHEEGLFHLALAHLENHTPAAAEQYLQALMKQNGKHQGALMAMANLLLAQQRHDEAKPYLIWACGHYPDLAQAQHALGKLFFTQGQYDKAQIHFARAVQLQPLDAGILCDFGVVLRKQNRLSEAEGCLRQAIALQADHADAHFNLADVLLFQGKFEEGWAEYEWRFRIKDRAPIFHDQALWRGEALAGKTILLHAEQGFGDSFQFLRYLPILKRQGARIIMECQTGLRRLLRACPYIDELVERTPTLATPENYDVYAPLLSLPGILQTDADTIPTELPYLFVEPATRLRWQARMAMDANFKIGIVWSGKPSHPDNINRRCALQDFAAIAAIPGVSIYSLQQGPAAAEFQAASWATALNDLHDEIDDFADTAAAIAALDLVISVDTSVAHLAGAMGRPVWVLLSAAPDWRWQTDRSDSPWYPSMRLFRRELGDDSLAPINAICAELPAWVAKPRVLVGAALEGTLNTADIYSSPLLISLRRARAAQARGEYAEARYELEAVLRGAPQHAETNFLLSEVLLAQGEYGEAQYIGLRVERLWPDHPPLIHLLGRIARARGEFGAAISYLERALNLGKEDVQTWQLLGECCLSMGLHTEALRAYKRAWEWRPNHPELCDKLGQLLQNAGQLEEALGFYQHALQVDANFFPAHFHSGNALIACGRPADAEIAFEAAVALRPDHGAAHNNLGVALKQQQRYEQAEGAFRKAIQVDPSYSEAYNNLGNVLALQSRDQEAQAAFREALRHDATNAQAYNNLGISLQASGALGAASQCYEAAILLRTNFAEAHWNLALVRLAQGDWKAGFAGYEWGFEAGIRWRLKLGSAVWDGQMAKNKTLFVHAEQGFGDTLQFIRFLRLARPRVGRLICCVQNSLHSLLQPCLINNAWADVVIAETDSVPEHDMHCALLSLPHLLGDCKVGVDIPYLQVAQDKLVPPVITKVTKGVLKVGLVWAGLPSHQHDQRRSLAASSFAPLLNLPGLALFSLQKGPAAADCLPGIQDLAPELHDFAATAAIVAHLDLVISVDTALAHLAGVMGVETWVLLAHAADWRWGLPGERSAWYPKLRLFRQTRAGEWQAPLADLVSALQALQALQAT